MTLTLTKQEFLKKYQWKYIFFNSVKDIALFVKQLESIGFMFNRRTIVLLWQFWDFRKNAISFDSYFYFYKTFKNEVCKDDATFYDGETIEEHPQLNNAEQQELLSKIKSKVVFNEQPKDKIKLVIVNSKKRQVLIKWTDGTETHSTCSLDDHFDHAVGFAIAFTRKFFKNDKKLKKFLDDKIPKSNKASQL